MGDGPGPSSRYGRTKEKKNDGNTSDSSSNSTKSSRRSSQKKSREPTPSIRKQWIDNVDPSIKHVGHRVDLLNSNKDKDEESLYDRAKKLMETGDGIKLPTTSEEYYDLEEMLLNPARMESGELSLNVYDEIRNSYNVLPGGYISETNFQKVIGCFSCDVCQEVIQHSIVNKKCGHRFCDQCILVALMRSGNTCPTCRQNLGSKRELQQDPRFDQLIDQVIESRSIVHRMMAEKRDHEKDVFFGRFGYIEGEKDWNKRYGIDTNPPKKKEGLIQHGEKSTVPWFDDASANGDVPECPYDSVSLKKLSTEASEAKLRALDGLPAWKTKSKQMHSTTTGKSAKTTTIDGIEIVDVTSDQESADESDQEESDLSDESETDGSSEFDSDSESEKDDGSEHSGDVDSDADKKRPKAKITKQLSKEVTKQNPIRLEESSDIPTETPTEEPMETSSDAPTEATSCVTRSKSRSKSPLEKAVDTPGTSEPQIVKKPKKFKASTIDIGLEDSEDESEDEVVPVPVQKKVVKARPRPKKQLPVKKGKGTKRKRRGYSSEDDLAPEIIDGDIPTPSEDSLTSTDDEEERRAGAYDFVFEEDFNFDPRRDGHPEKDKLFNFDWMIDMEARINRKYEEDGEDKIRSDDSNSEPDSDESCCSENSIVLGKSVVDKVKKFLTKKPQSEKKGLEERKESDDIIIDEALTTAKKKEWKERNKNKKDKQKEKKKKKKEKNKKDKASKDIIMDKELSTDTSKKQSPDDIIVDEESTEASKKESSDDIITDETSSTDNSKKKSSDGVIVDEESPTDESKTRASDSIIVDETVSTDASKKISADEIIVNEELTTDAKEKKSTDIIIDETLSTVNSKKKASDDVIIDETLTTFKKPILKASTGKKSRKGKHHGKIVFDLKINNKVEKRLAGLGSLHTDDRMFDGFLFRPGDDAAGRPTLERDPDFKHHDLISNPTDVYLVYPPLVPKKSNLQIPPKGYRVPSSDSESSDEEDYSSSEDESNEEDDGELKNVKMVTNIEVEKEPGTSSKSPPPKASSADVSTKSTFAEPMDQEAAPTDLEANKVGDAEPDKVLSSEPGTSDSGLSTKDSIASVDDETEPGTSDKVLSAEDPAITLDDEAESVSSKRHERVSDRGYNSDDDLASIWEEMQALGIHDFSENELDQLLAKRKTSMKSKVFYDTTAKTEHHLKFNSTLTKYVEKMNMDDITSMTNVQTAHEDNKTHRRRLALLNSAVTVAKEFRIKIESSDEEENGAEVHMEEEQVDDDEILEEEEKEDAPPARRSADVAKSDSKTATPTPMETDDPIIDEQEDDFSAILFDENEPCSSAQAAKRDKILERMERGQQLIEESLNLQNKPSTSEPVFKVPHPPVLDDGVFKRPRTPDRAYRRRKETRKKTRKDTPMETGSQQRTGKSSDKKKVKLMINKRKTKLRAYIEEDFLGSEDSESDDSDYETKLASLMVDVDAEVIKPSIAEYASLEYIKTATAQANSNDVPNALSFLCRPIEGEFEDIMKTGKRSERDPDDVKLEDFVRNFRKDYAKRNPPVPFKTPANLDRKLIDKSMIVKSKHLMEMDVLQMKILVALQKQQIAASCASLSQPVTVTPQEHAEQVALLTNLQKPAILQPLMQNPQFAATLHKAQQQAIRQQQAQQKAILQRELAMRKAEQARVEELARKRIAQEKIDAEAARKAELEKMGVATEPNQSSTQSSTQQSEASSSAPQSTPNERAVDVVAAGAETKMKQTTDSSDEQLFELDQSMSEDPEPSETILAGNVSHLVDKTIEDGDEPRNESPNLLEDESMNVDKASTSQYEDHTIDIDDELLLVDDEESKKQCEKDMDREMINYASRYYQGTMAALTERGMAKHNKLAEQEREAQELQEMISLSAAGVTKEYKPHHDEEDEEQKKKEPEFQMDQLVLAKSILQQRQGYEPFGESDESEEDEEYDIDTGELVEKTPRVRRQARQRTSIFIPNIPLKIRRKYIEKKLESERNKLKNRIKTAKLAAIRINVPPRPPPPPQPQQPQFATPKLPAHRGKHPAGPRAAPKAKKAKMANVQMSIVEPPQPLHQLQGHMGAPTKITAVPNTAAAAFHVQQQQQVYTAMSQVPQSTPIRPSTATPVPHQQSHLAQLGQLVHGTLPPSNLPANPQAAVQLQAAHAQQVSQTISQAEAAVRAQAGQTPNPAGPSQQDLLNQLNAQLAVQRAQQEEMTAIHQILQARGQFPPINQEQFMINFGQAQAEYRAAVQAQAQAQMASFKAAQEQALMKQVQEQQRLQAAAKEAARLKAEAEKKAKAKAEAEARRKAEQAERARKAKEEAKAREQAQAQAQIRAQAQAAQAAQMAHAAQTAQAHQTFMEIQAAAAAGHPLTTEQLQKLQQLAQMPHVVPMHDLHQIKNLLLQHMVMNYRMGTPQPPMPMMPGMFPGHAPMQAAARPEDIDLMRRVQEATNLAGQRALQQNQLLQQQQQQQQQMAQGMLQFNPMHFQMLQQQQYLQQLMAQQASARGTPAINMYPAQIPGAATPAPAIPTPAPVAVPPAVTPAVVAAVPLAAPVPTPQPVQHAQPEVTSGNVELEIWPSNGFTRKNNLQGPNAAALFFSTPAGTNLNHVACLIRSRLMCDNVGTLWVLRLEDGSVQHFRLDQKLAEAQQFVGRQHVIMFYDEAEAGATPQTNEYIINKDFQPHTKPRN